MPPKHPEDGPVLPDVARAQAAAIIAAHHDQDPDHAASQKAERLDDPGHQHDHVVGPEWSQNADGDWVHSVEG